MAENTVPNTRPKSFRGALWSLGLLALLMSVFTVSLVHYYGGSRPTIRDDAARRTHAVPIHARTVFLTSGEMAAVLGTHAIAILSIGVFLGVLLKSRRSPKPRNGQPKAA